MPDSKGQTGRELRRLLGPLRRAVVRAAPVLEPDGALSGAQVELLRTVAHTGPLTTTELANRLHLARPTVSNLVKPLAHSGMLTRELSRTDLRAVIIDITPRARARIAATDASRDAVLQHAIDQLTPSDRSTLDAALPVLARLLERIRADSTHPRVVACGTEEASTETAAAPQKEHYV